MKKILCTLLCIVCPFVFFSCKGGTESDLDILCEYYWESYVDIMQFTRDGKILRSFEFDHESVSYFKLSDGKITMYAEGDIENGLTFDYELRDDKLYIGELEYRKYQKVESGVDDKTENVKNQPKTEKNVTE